MEIIIPKIDTRKQIMEIEKCKQGVSAIYALFNEGICIYVGQSTNLSSRVFNHLSEKEFDYIEYFLCEKVEANNFEAKTIVKHKPLLNSNLPKNDIYIGMPELRDRLFDLLANNSKIKMEVFHSEYETRSREIRRRVFVSKERADEVLEKIMRELEN